MLELHFTLEATLSCIQVDAYPCLIEETELREDMIQVTQNSGHHTHNLYHMAKPVTDLGNQYWEPDEVQHPINW